MIGLHCLGGHGFSSRSVTVCQITVKHIPNKSYGLVMINYGNFYSFNYGAGTS